jgi:peptidoglycan/xylan/chitin deacetylase (PgdA/CDA1 family)
MISALIPAYRAGASVGAVVAGARPFVDGVLVVDDGSNDGTSDAARAAGARVLRLASNSGKGAALRAGFADLLARGAAAVVTLDADGQHDPREIPRLVDCWRETGAALVIGERSGLEERATPLRRFGNRFSRRAVSWFAGVAVPDAQSGFRLYDAALLRALPLRGGRYELESEVIVRAARGGWRLASVPVEVACAEGTATSHFRPWRDTTRICVAVVGSRLAHRRTLLAASGIALHGGLLGAVVGLLEFVPVLAAACVAYHGWLAWGVMHPRSRLFGPNRSRLCTPERVVALTFDDGPHPEITPKVLEILRERGVRATFFLIGKWVERHPDLARRIVADGHAVGNHTQRHSCAFWAHSPRRLAGELEQAQRAIHTACGETCRWFRAPVGLKSPFLHEALARRGLELVSWDARRLGRLPRDRARLMRRLERRLVPGSILLLHDGHDRRPEGNPAVVGALPVVLDALAALDYRCVPLG